MSVTFASGEDSITLRSPDMGNDESANLNRAINISRHGTIRLFSNDRPIPITHNLSFGGICDTDVAEIKDYFENTAGKQQTYTDSAGNNWLGTIAHPVTFNNTSRDNHSFVLNFIGKLS